MQGDGPFTDGINVTIRRNYIYEDAYDKLSPENGTETRVRYWLLYTPLRSDLFIYFLVSLRFILLSGRIAEQVQLLLVNLSGKRNCGSDYYNGPHKSRVNYFKSPLLCLNLKGHLSGDTLIKKSRSRPGLKT